ncbi:phage holin family protein [Paenibacillus pasadenensis]|uniref:phage holin family protein n=1 Tax=Paenibacillus pasadenensis TaxID=217090 RepID=UPI00203E95A2|nr:phage holin family protein [Paenibacillus pasadenensis]MCM3746219.1 phage holin family protein [Paenibacillus pasadenensis]
MSVEALSELINPDLSIVVAACWVIGMILKGTPQIPNWTIVYIVSFVAIVLAMALLGFTVRVALQGLLCGAVSVYGHQIMKQTREAVRSNAKKGDS